MAVFVAGRMMYIRLVAITVGALMGFIVSLSDVDTSTPSAAAVVVVKTPSARRRPSERLRASWQPPPIVDKPGPLDLNDGILRDERQQPRAKSENASTVAASTLLREVDELFKGKPVVNRHDYFYTIDPKRACADDDLFLVAYVHTAPDHKERRALVRRTWANSSVYRAAKVRVFFVMGQPSTRRLQRDVEHEARRYGDVVQESYVDAYRNLSLKAVGALRWVTTRCRRARFVLKTDDDVFVNLFGLLPHLRALDERRLNASRLLMCLVWRRMHVLREGKWAVPKETFPDEFYPPYCSGIAYVMSPDVANAIYRASAYVPPFWVDDVYVTGMIPKAIGLRHLDIGRLFFNRNELAWLLSGADWYKYLFSHLRDAAYYEQMWKLLERRALSDAVPKMKDVAPGKLATSYGPKKPPEWFVKRQKAKQQAAAEKTVDKKKPQPKKNAVDKKKRAKKEKQSQLI